MDEDLISFYGLWCGDGIPSCKELFTMVDMLEKILADLQFEQYTELKSEITLEFRDYPVFLSVLHQITGFRKSGPSRSGGGTPGVQYGNVRRTGPIPVISSVWYGPAVHSFIVFAPFTCISMPTSISSVIWGRLTGS